MKSFKVFTINRGYSFINGELLEVLVKSYCIQDTGIIDILVEHRGEEYWTYFDNFYNSVDGYEKGQKACTTTKDMWSFVNFENYDELLTWVIKDNQPVRVSIAPEALNVFVDSGNNLTLGDEVPKETFSSYERAMMYCDLTIKKDNGTVERKESLVKAIKPNEEQMVLLNQLREIEKKICESGLEYIIDTSGDRYFINTEKIRSYEISETSVDGMTELFKCDATEVPFGYGHCPIFDVDNFFWVKR